MPRPTPDTAGVTAGLAARTRRVDTDVDLLTVAGRDGVVLVRDGVGLAGRGTAATIGLTGRQDDGGASAVTQALAAIATQDPLGRAGCGPVGFGALPFDPAAPAELVIPSVIVGRAGDGTRWLTTVGPDDDPRHDLDAATLLHELAEGVDGATIEASDASVASVLPATDWCEAVAEVRDAIRSGSADKVVLAREVLITCAEPIDRLAVLRRLRASYGSSFCYAVGGFIGASPELLVDRHGDIVRAHPMAGTVARSGDAATDARLAAGLLASAKDQHEHRITIDMVHATLLPWCSYLDEEAEPSVVAVANVQHLATLVEGRLSAPPASVLELVGALHPTPAVCGTPREAALALIETHEHLQRDAYGGPVGWVDATGQGTWAVGIRCAAVSGASARLFAGVGVVEDSDPVAELAESQAKLRALLDALIRP